MIFWRFDDDVEIIIWKTDESVDETLLFFAPEIQEVHREKLESIKYEKRRKEYLCARLLIDIIAGEGQRVEYLESGRPYLTDCHKEISISHTKNYVAVIADDDKRVAIDIEVFGKTVEKVKNRFCTQQELEYLSEDDDIRLLQLHLIWSAKETAYKLLDEKGIYFEEHLHVLPFKLDKNGIMHCNVIKDNTVRNIKMAYKVFDDFVMVWAVGAIPCGCQDDHQYDN